MTIGTISVPHVTPPPDRVTVGSYGTRNYPPAYWRELHRRRDSLGTIYQDFRGTLQNKIAVQSKRPFASTYRAMAKMITNDLRKAPLFDRLRNPPSSQVPIVRAVVGPEGVSPWYGPRATRPVRDFVTVNPHHPRNPDPHPYDNPRHTDYKKHHRPTKKPTQGFGATYDREWTSGTAR